MITDSDILRNTGGLHQHSLTHILHLDEDTLNTDDELPVIRHSPYFDNEQLISKLGGKSNNFNILSLNTQSLHAKFDQIKIMLNYLEKQNVFFSAICLQETWLAEKADVSLLFLDKYKLITQGKFSSPHGGLAIYLHERYDYTVLPPTKSAIWEGQFIQINETETKTNITLGNIYRPPRDILNNYQTFIQELALVLQSLDHTNSDVVIAGDMNIDLLKINDRAIFSEYFDMILASGFFPSITLPTRITNRSATLIDNFLCKFTKRSSSTFAGVLLSALSDHFPYFVSLDDTRTKEHSPKYIKVKQTSTAAVTSFKDAISASNMHTQLNSNLNTDPNINYDIVHSILNKATKQYLSTKMVKYNKHRHKKSAWITHGIIKSITFRDKLYKQLKATPIDTSEYDRLKINLTTYNKILKTNIQLAKQNYYNTRFEKYKHNIKNTWSTIKDILNKNKNKKSFPKFFKINGEEITNKYIIANKFNDYFTNIGSSLAANIKVNSNKSYKDYLTTPHNCAFHFQLH